MCASSPGASKQCRVYLVRNGCNSVGNLALLVAEQEVPKNAVDRQIINHMEKYCIDGTVDFHTATILWRLSTVTLR